MDPGPRRVWLTGCGDGAPGPAAPSGPQSFLTGTWQGAVTIQVNPGIPNALAPTSGSTTWPFEVVPQIMAQPATLDRKAEAIMTDDIKSVIDQLANSLQTVTLLSTQLRRE